MNGRALNEKAIEVSPSSSRVLDRAAEILTPFPPSKNRPRPGDWNCPSCGFSNFQRRTACFRCSFPAAGANVDPYSGYGQYNQYGGGHHGGYQQHHHPHPHHHGRGNGPVPFRAGDWRCGSEGCSYHNFAKNVNCLRCGAPRSGAAVVVDQSYHHSPMAPPPDFGMGPPGSMGGTPGPGSFGPGAQAFGSGAAFAQPPHNNYGMPSMGPPGPGFPQMGGMTPGYASANMSQHSFGPAAQAAFSGAADTNPGAGGPPQNGFYGNEQNADPFAFLSAGMGGLSVGDENQNSNSRRNGGPQSAKSPA